jgi:hypothetical protein
MISAELFTRKFRLGSIAQNPFLSNTMVPGGAGYGEGNSTNCLATNSTPMAQINREAKRSIELAI